MNEPEPASQRRLRLVSKNTFEAGYSKPLAENPDYGLVGNPSTAEGATSVASVDNTVVTE